VQLTRTKKPQAAKASTSKQVKNSSKLLNICIGARVERIS
jgi:hypothetical protein